MKKTNTQSLGEVLRQVLDDQNLSEKINEQRVIDSWQPLLGPGVAQYTTRLYIRNKVLNVHISSAVLKAELMMYREKLIKALNERVGETVILDIMFR
jgi:predicted nucleic acid-binding Zn ribbon protein